MIDKPTSAKLPAISDSPHAPFLFFENAPTFGFVNGIVSITLSAGRTYVGPDGVISSEQVVVAHLRSNIQAVLGLKQAIESALLLATPTNQDKAS